MSDNQIIDTADRVHRVSLPVQALRWCVYTTARGFLICCYSRVGLIGFAVCAAGGFGWVTLGLGVPLTLGVAVIGSCAVLWGKKPQLVQQRLYGYLMGWRYRPFLLTKLWDCGIRGRKPPLHLSTWATRYVVKLRIRMSDGQTIHDYRYAAAAIGPAFNAQRCSIRIVPKKKRQGEKEPRIIEIGLIIRDPLLEIVQPLKPESNDPLPKDGIPLVKVEDGTWWRLRYMHTLIAAVSGGGKSGVFRALIYYLQPAVQQYLAQIWVADPKQGPEFSNAEHLFARFTRENIHEHAAMFYQLKLLMWQRLEAMYAKKQSLHTPTPIAPAIFLFVDEYMSFDALTTDLKMKRRIKRDLGELRTKGRAAAIYVFVTVIDPRVEVIKDRDQHPVRIGLKLQSASQTNSALGEDAHKRGALCDEIDPHYPGTCYVALEIGDILRGRVPNITNEMVAALPPAPTPLGQKQRARSTPSTPQETSVETTPPAEPPLEIEEETPQVKMPGGLGGFA